MNLNRTMPGILAGRILPSFFDADEGGGGGGAGAAVAEPGDVVVAAAPVTDADNAAIANFKAADLGELPDFLGGDGGKSASEAKTLPEPKIDPKSAPEVKPAEKKEAVASLRTAYETSQRELAEAREQLAKGDPRIAEKEQMVAEAKAELEDYKAKVTDYERRIAEVDARNAPSVLALQKQFADKAERFYERVVNMDDAKAWELTKEFNALPQGEGRREAFAAFEQKVNEILGGSEDRPHPHLERTIDHITEYRKFALASDAEINRVKSNVEGYRVEQARTHYNTSKERVEKNIAAGRVVPDGMRESSPAHPAVVLDTVRKELGDEIKKFENGIDEFTRLVFAGVPPRTDKDFIGLTPQQIQETRMEEANKVEMARDYAAQALPQGMLALRVLHYYVKENARLRELTGQNGAPPDPAGARKEDAGKGHAGGDNVREFVAPPIPDIGG